MISEFVIIRPTLSYKCAVAIGGRYERSHFDHIEGLG